MLKNFKNYSLKEGFKSNVFDETIPDPTDTIVLNGIDVLKKIKMMQ